MKVQVKNLPHCGREIHVEIPAEKVLAEVENIYQRVLQDAKVDGFRKGKAPLSIIKQRYKEVVKREIEETILLRYFQEAIISENIQPVSKPRIKDYHYEEGVPMIFTAHIEVRPEFELKNYKGFRIKKAFVEVKDDDVEKALFQMREYSAPYEPVENRPIMNGDLVIVDFESRMNGVPLEGGKAKHHPVHVGSGDMIPGFEDALLGLRKGETHTFQLVFPSEYPKKEIAGKEVEFTVAVNEIKQKQLPVVDEEFAKSAAGCDNVTQLKEKIRVQIAQAKENDQRTHLIEQVTDKLIKENKFDVPESWLALETIQLIRNGIQQLRHHGVDPNQWDQKQKNEFNDKMRVQAERNVRIAVLIDRIAEAEKIECHESDWEAYLNRMANNTGQTPESIKQSLKQKGQSDDIRERIRHEKTLDLLLDVAQVEVE